MNVINRICSNIKERRLSDLIIAIISLIAIIITLYYLFTYGIATLQGDVNISYRYARAMEWSHELFPKDWLFVNSEVYIFRVTSIASFIGLIVKNQVLGRILADVIFLGITIIVINHFFKNYFKDNGTALTVILFLLYLGGIETRTMILTEGTYVSEFLAIVLTIPLMFNVLDFNVGYHGQNKFKYIKSAILYGIVVFLMVAGGVRYLAEQILPMICAILIYKYLSYRVDKNKKVIIDTVVSFAVVLIPSVLGWFFYKWICSTHFMNSGAMDKMTFPDSVSILFQNFIKILGNFVACFGYIGGTEPVSWLGLRNLISIVSFAFICIVIPIMQLKKYKDETQEVKFFMIFALCHNVLMFTVAVAFDKNWERYLLSTIYVCILLSVRYVYSYWFKNNVDKWLFIIILFGATVIESMVMYKSTLGWKEIYDSHMRIVNELESRGLYKGYGNYWTALTYEIYANGDLVCGQVDIRDRAQPQLWDIDYAVYEKAADKSFLMLTEEEVKLAENSLQEIFGDYSDEFEINDVYLFDFPEYTFSKGNLFVYTYDYDISEKFHDGFADGEVTVKDLYFAEGGMIYDDGSCYIYSCGMLKGPYMRIEPGDYKLYYIGENVDDLIIDIQSEQSPNDVSFEVLDISDDKVEVTLHIKHTVDDVDFRAYVGGENPVRFKKITVEKY